MNRGKIVVLGTGGTIAGRAASATDNVGYRSGELPVADVLQGVPGIDASRVEAHQVAQLDSKDMDHATWRALALACADALARADVAGVVVTHGTDTMEETAWFLQCVLPAAKPVVLTGAMRPASALAPDGPGNLADALQVAAAPGARGVCVVFAGVIHAARDVMKVHPYRVDAFDSGEAGPLGFVEEGGLRLLRAWPQADPVREASSLPPVEAWPRVAILTSHAGADGGVVRALLHEGIDGIVLATTGNGTVHRELEVAAQQALARGVRVLRASRCVLGSIVGEAGPALPHAGDLSPVQARIRLLLELMH